MLFNFSAIKYSPIIANKLNVTYLEANACSKPKPALPIVVIIAAAKEKAISVIHSEVSSKKPFFIMSPMEIIVANIIRTPEIKDTRTKRNSNWAPEIVAPPICKSLWICIPKNDPI